MYQTLKDKVNKKEHMNSWLTAKIYLISCWFIQQNKQWTIMNLHGLNQTACNYREHTHVSVHISITAVALKQTKVNKIGLSGSS